jgi:mannosidase alpha-like ER degradation enhancer 2
MPATAMTSDAYLCSWHQNMRTTDKMLGIILLALACACGAVRDDFNTRIMSKREAVALREEVREMFYFAYNSYKKYAMPMDDLLPSSCQGKNFYGGQSVTIVDALDTLAVMGDVEEFESAINWVAANVRYDIDAVVSVFETNIRSLGGLLSAHLLASDPDLPSYLPNYNGELLELAIDLGWRLVRAFETPTGMPYGSVNLRHGCLHIPI